MAATLDLGPQIQNLREAELDRAPCRLGLKRSRHYVRSLRCQQVGGFEGAPVISVVEAPDYAAILQLVDKPLVKFNRGATPLPDCGVMEQPHDPIITRVDKPFKPKFEPVEVLGPEAHELGKPLLTHVRPRPGKLRWRQPLAIRGEGSGLIGATRRITSGQARREPLPTSPHDFNVLHRHRSPSIPQGRVASAGLGGPDRSSTHAYLDVMRLDLGG